MNTDCSRWCCLFVGYLFCCSVFAGDSGSLHSSDKTAYQVIVDKVKKHQPELIIDSIEKSPVDGLLQVISDGEIYYIDTTGEFFIDGDIFDVRSLTNITRNKKVQKHLQLIEAIGEDNMIVYEPQGDVKGSLTVFTDTSCPYCVKFHEGLQRYLSDGIRVRYLLYPRSGLDSDSYKELMSIWCSSDRNNSMDIVKGGGSITASECVNPIQAHFETGDTLNLQGTPLIYTSNGKQIEGFMNVKDLLDNFE